MKRFSFIPLILAIVIYIIFPFKELQFLSIAIILIYLQAFISSFISTKSFRVSREKPLQYCKTGEEEFVSLSVENISPFNFRNIEIYDKGAGCYENGSGEYIKDFCSGESVSFKTRVDQVVRGQYPIGPVVIKGSDPLKLFPWSISIKKYVDVIIYPKISNLDSVLKAGERGGRIKVKNPMYQDLTELKSIRDFRSGDSIRNINWKTTAKTGKLQVMEFSNTITTPLFITLDLDPCNYPIKYRYTYIEKAIEAAASLVAEYNINNQPVGIYFIDGKERVLIPISSGYSHTINILEHLATISISKGAGINIINGFLEENYRIPQGTHLYLLSPCINKDFIPVLELLKRKKVFIKTVNTGDGGSNNFLPAYCENYYLNLSSEEMLNAI